MIHDAVVEVTCDGPGCSESTFVPLPATTRGGYTARDADIEAVLAREGWTVQDGQHFCEGCVEAVAERLVRGT